MGVVGLKGAFSNVKTCLDKAYLLRGSYLVFREDFCWLEEEEEILC